MRQRSVFTVWPALELPRPLAWLCGAKLVVTSNERALAHELARDFWMSAPTEDGPPEPKFEDGYGPDDLDHGLQATPVQEGSNLYLLTGRGVRWADLPFLKWLSRTREVVFSAEGAYWVDDLAGPEVLEQAQSSEAAEICGGFSWFFDRGHFQSFGTSSWLNSVAGLEDLDLDGVPTDGEVILRHADHATVRLCTDDGDLQVHLAVTPDGEVQVRAKLIHGLPHHGPDTSAALIFPIRGPGMLRGVSPAEDQEE